MRSHSLFSMTYFDYQEVFQIENSSTNPLVFVFQLQLNYFDWTILIILRIFHLANLNFWLTS